MAAGVLRIVQLNAGTLLEPGWDERRGEVAAWLARLTPDVVCLQEIWASDRSPSTAAALVEHLDGTWHHAFGGAPLPLPVVDEPGLRFGSAVLSRWPIEHQELRRLPLAPGASTFVAAVPWEAFHVRTAGLDVFSVHLAPPPDYGRHRILQVLALDDFVRSVRGDRDELPPFGQRRQGMPAIVCGDGNAEPDSDEVRFLTGLAVVDGRTTFFQDAWRVAGEGPGLTQDWSTHPLAAALNVHRKRIDYVLVGDPFLRAGDAGRVLRAELAFHHPLTGVLASDHCGLVVDVVWPDRPA